MYNLYWLTHVFFSVENDTYTWILFSCMCFYGVVTRCVSMCFFMYILTLHCIFLAHIYIRILTFWLMLSVVKTTLNEFYFILSYLHCLNCPASASQPSSPTYLFHTTFSLFLCVRVPPPPPPPPPSTPHVTPTHSQPHPVPTSYYISITFPFDVVR